MKIIKINMEIDLLRIDNALKNQWLEYDNNRWGIVKINT